MDDTPKMLRVWVHRGDPGGDYSHVTLWVESEIRDPLVLNMLDNAGKRLRRQLRGMVGPTAISVDLQLSYRPQTEEDVSAPTNTID